MCLAQDFTMDRSIPDRVKLGWRVFSQTVESRNGALQHCSDTLDSSPEIRGSELRPCYGLSKSVPAEISWSSPHKAVFFLSQIYVVIRSLFSQGCILLGMRLEMLVLCLWEISRSATVCTAGTLRVARKPYPSSLGTRGCDDGQGSFVGHRKGFLPPADGLCNKPNLSKVPLRPGSFERGNQYHQVFCLLDDGIRRDSNNLLSCLC